MSEPLPADAAAAAAAFAVQKVRQRLRWGLVGLAAFIVVVLAGGGFSFVSFAVATVAAVFLLATFLGLRAFASIGGGA